MSDDVKISVIIPVYNVEKYIKECLQSVTNQTFKDIEIICIDDGSTDNSLGILKEYQKKDERIIILNQEHKGAGTARNLGLKNAKGKYIQFLDSDDYFELNLLEKMYQKAENFNLDIVICSSKKVDDEGNVIEINNPNNPINLSLVPLEKTFNPKEFKENIFSLFTPMPWNKLYLRNFLLENDIKFPPLKIYEDVAFVHSSIACAKRVLAFDEKLINYRYNRKGSLANSRAKNTIEIVKSCLYLKDFLNKNNLFEEFKNAYEKIVVEHICSEISFCNSEEYNNFFKEFKKLLPDEWEKYESALRKDYITPEYLKKFIGNKKVMLWGASLFIRQVLENEKEKNENILGIIDKNSALWGEKIANYEIFSPEIIEFLKPDGIILTVLSNNEIIYENLKEELKFGAVLLPNIFEEEIIFE